jgi:hypothetical protein
MWRPAVDSPSTTMIFFIAIQSWMDDSTHHAEKTCPHETVPVGSAHPMEFFKGTRIWRCPAWA